MGLGFSSPHLLGRVGDELVDGHDGADPVLGAVPDVVLEVGAARRHQLHVAGLVDRVQGLACKESGLRLRLGLARGAEMTVWRTDAWRGRQWLEVGWSVKCTCRDGGASSVHLEGSDRGDDDRYAGDEAAVPALDVEELLHT